MTDAARSVYREPRLLGYPRAHCVYCGWITRFPAGTYPAACTEHLSLLILDPLYASEWAAVIGAQQ